MKRSFWIGFIGGLAILLSVQSYVVSTEAVSRGKSESNFFSSRARLQRASTVEEPHIVFLGSSITGRLPSTEDAVAHAMNLGVDGGTPLAAAVGLLDGPFTVPPLVVVESNTLFTGIGSKKNNNEFGLGTWFDVGCGIKILRADARPSGMIYQWLRFRSRKNNSIKLEYSEPTIEIDQPTASVFEAFDPTPNQRERFEKMVATIHKLKKQSRVVVMHFPTPPKSISGEMVTTVQHGRALAAAAGVEFADLSEAFSDSGLRYTDAVHMDEPSGEFVMQSVMRRLGASAPQ